MGKLREDLKQKLKEAGQWDEYIRYRDELKGEGLSPKEAQLKAVEKFFNNPPEVIGQSGKKFKGKNEESSGPLANKGSESSSARSGTVIGGVSAQGKSEVKDGSQAGSTPLPFVDLEVFEGKQATEVEVIRWVARNMMVSNPSTEECPDATAWALLAHCRMSPLAVAEFWKTTYTKLLPSRAQMEVQKGDNETDGSKALEVIEDLLRISAEAKRSCGVS